MLVVHTNIWTSEKSRPELDLNSFDIIIPGRFESADKKARKITQHASSYLLAITDFCCQLMTFANSLDQEQDSQIVRPDLDTSRLTLIVFLKEFNEKSQHTTII